MEVHVHLENAFPGGIGNRRITFDYNLWVASHKKVWNLNWGPLSWMADRGLPRRPVLGRGSFLILCMRAAMRPVE